MYFEELKHMEERTTKMEYGAVKRIEAIKGKLETVKRSNTLIPGLPHEIAILCIARVPRSFHHKIRSVCQSWRDFHVLILGLPNKIAILCIARVPHSCHLGMSGVCRGWRNLIHGRVFSDLRCELGLGEDWLYFRLQEPNSWYCSDLTSQNLPAMPYDNRIDGHSSHGSVDGLIFVIGGRSDESNAPCKTVTCFNARSHSWKRIADLNVARAQCLVNIVDNQLAVSAGYINSTTTFAQACDPSTSTTDAYDLRTDTWNFISSEKFPFTMLDKVANIIKL